MRPYREESRRLIPVFLVTLELAMTFGRVALAETRLDSKQVSPTTSKEQFVYNLSLANGRSYESTFSPRAAETIYLLAGTDNVVRPYRAPVHYWPITQEYIADWSNAVEVSGTLEVFRGRKLWRVLKPEAYAFSYPRGSSSSTVVLLRGHAAKEKSAGFRRELEQYRAAMNRYYAAEVDYERSLTEYLVHPKGRKLPKSPREPEPPTGFVTDVANGYLLNLPAGTYTVRFQDVRGRTVSGSQKRVVAFTERHQGIAYEILPEERWTKPERSDEPSQVIYSDGKRTLYVRPFQAREYSRLPYTKLSQLANPGSGRGSEGTWSWVYLEPAGSPGRRLQLVKSGRVVQAVRERPYYVRQRPGRSLGYEIVEFRAKEMEALEPTFSAYRVELADSGAYSLYFVDEAGRRLPGSDREIQIVADRGGALLTFLSLMPVMFGVGVWTWRRRLGRSSSGPSRRF